MKQRGDSTPRVQHWKNTQSRKYVGWAIQRCLESLKHSKEDVTHRQAEARQTKYTNHHYAGRMTEHGGIWGLVDWGSTYFGCCGDRAGEKGSGLGAGVQSAAIRVNQNTILGGQVGLSKRANNGVFRIHMGLAKRLVIRASILAHIAIRLHKGVGLGGANPRSYWALRCFHGTWGWK